MKSISSWFFSAAALFALGGLLFSRGRRDPLQPPRAPAAPRATAVVRGLALGDSLTAAGGYVEGLRRATGAPWDIVATVGIRSAAILRNAESALAPQRYSHVVVLAGINDGDLDPQRTIDNLTAICRLVKASGARVILVSETPHRGYVGFQQRAWDRHLAVRQWMLSQGRGVADVVVDSYQALEDPARPGWLRPDFARDDRLHLNGEGQGALGRLIAGALR